MLRIGLTGGIASGKSAASACFADLGASVVDHDDLAHEAVKPGSAALADIAREFGDSLVVGGELDRARLADLVFGDPEGLARLNAIVHPYVYALADAADRKARLAGVKVIVHAIPLLVETSAAGRFDLVATVGTPVQHRVRRMIADRGMTTAQAEARIAAQATDEERAAISDVVFDGSGTVEGLCEQVVKFWNEHVPLSHAASTLNG